MTVTVGIAGQTLTVQDPGADAAGLLARTCWLDERRYRHWSTQHVAALAYRMVPDEDHIALTGLLSRAAPAVPPATLRAAVRWAAEQVTGRAFGPATVLAGWYAVNARVVRGRILLAGGRPADGYGLADALDMADAVLEERVGREELDKRVAKAWESREEWGVSTVAQAGVAAMMNL